MPLLFKDRNFIRKVVMLGGPISAQQLITVGVNMMDAVMLGQLNETALSAGSMATQIHHLYHFMCMGLAMGASVLLARYWGAGEQLSIKKTLTLMYRFCLLIAFLFTFAVAASPNGIMRLLTPDEGVITEGARYLLWSLPCFLLYGFSLTTTMVLRNTGQMHIPLCTSIGAFFINIFFNWIFIFGKLGAPAMGVAGAALGTLISRLFEFTVICGFFLLKDTKIRFRLRDMLEPCKDMLPEYLRISMPVLISDTLLGIGNSITAAVAGHIGKAFMSANTITSVTQQITTVFTAGLGQSAVIITGNTLGKGDEAMAQKQGISFAVFGFLVGCVCGVIIICISPFVVNSYNITEETRAVAIELMRSVGIVTVFMSVSSILTKGVLRGGGDTKFLMVADVFFLWVVSVPLGACAGLLWDWPPFWVFFCLRIDNAIKAVWCLFRLRSRKWIKKIRTVGENC